jgi:hypothetical protein
LSFIFLEITLPAVKVAKIPKTNGINISDDIFPIKKPTETTAKQRTEMMNFVDSKLLFIKF